MWLTLLCVNHVAFILAVAFASLNITTPLVELQADDDPPEELLEAAERACEVYDNAIRNTDALRQQYLAFCEKVDTDTDRARLA
jgi:hypothetical protein